MNKMSHQTQTVDASKKPRSNRNKTVLLLSRQYTEATSNMIDGVLGFSSGNLQIDYATYDELTFLFKDGKMNVWVDRLQKDVAEYDIVHFKTSLGRDITAALARYVVGNGHALIDDAVQYYPDMSKLYQYSILAQNKLAVPDSVFVTPSQLEDSYELFTKELGVPFVLKGIHARWGEVNTVITSQDDFAKTAKVICDEGIYVIAQRFVPNQGDYRVLVFGRQIRLIIHRIRKDDSTHLNNTSAGGTARLVPANELPAQVQKDCIRAAIAMDRGIAGVDAIQDMDSGKWFFLEVNDGPQLATGAFLEEKHRALAAFLEEKQ